MAPAGWITDVGAVAANGSAPDNPIGYGGYTFNAASGEYLVRHRSYEPELGRFLQRDPSGYADGMSLYLYASASPWGMLDPMGLEPWGWIPSWSDIAHGRTLVYQATPSLRDITAGRTLAYQGYRYLRQTPATEIVGDAATAARTQFYDGPRESARTARLNAAASGAGYWERAWRGAAVGMGSFFGWRDMYEGHVGRDILTYECLSAREQSLRLLGGLGQFAAIVSAPTAAQQAMTRATAAWGSVRATAARLASRSGAAVGRAPVRSANPTTVLSDVTVVSHGRVVGRGNVYLRPTLEGIESGKITPRDIFENREGLLPAKPPGYYQEFVHPTPGVSGVGSQRIIRGSGGELYYTPDHYASFVPLN